MDINNNIQINTFSKGMNTDTSDALLDSLEYRKAVNLRVVSGQLENDNELHPIDDIDIANYIDTYVNIYATTKLRDRVVIIGQKNSTTWLVDVFEADKKTGIYYPDTVFGPCEELLDSNKISTVARYEDNDNKKLYIADGVHNIMMINLDLGSSDAKREIKDISSFKEHTFGGFSDYTITTGSLKPALVQHAYVLYDRYGVSSQLSPLTKPYFITKTEDGKTVGYKQGEVSGMGLSFTIHEQAGDFTKILIYRVTYQQRDQQPSIELVCDDELKDTDYTFIDSGQNPISTLSVAEFIALDNVGIVPREIESKNNYLFASNIKYQIGDNSKALKRFANLDLNTETPERKANLDFNVQYNPSVWPTVIADIDSFYNGVRSTTIAWAYIQQSGESGLRSLKRNEVYRYGIVLYDKYGNRWPVKWFADVRTPDIPTKEIYNNDSFRSINVVVYVNLAKINGTLIPGYFTGYEVVRCERTVEYSRSLSQGIVGRPIEVYGYNTTNSNIPFIDFYLNGQLLKNTVAESLYEDDKNSLFPSGLMTMYDVFSETADTLEVLNTGDNDNLIEHYDYPPSNLFNGDTDKYAKSQNKIILFASTESCYGEDIYNKIKNRSIALSFTKLYDATNIGRGNTIGTRLYTYNDTNKRPQPVQDDFHEYETYCLYTNNPDGTYGYLFTIGGYRRFRSSGESRLARTMTLVHPYDIFVGPGHYDYVDHNPNYYPSMPNSFYTSYDNTKQSNPDRYKNIFNYFDCRDNNDYRWTINATIDSVKLITAPEQGSFSKQDVINLQQYQLAIGEKTFTPWSAPFLATYRNLLDSSIYTEDNVADFDGDYGKHYHYPMGMSGKGLLLQMSNSGEQTIRQISELITADNVSERKSIFTATRAFGAYVFDIINNGVTPYGGYSDYARQNSIYLSHGIYNTRDYPVVADDGDIFLVDFYYTALHYFYDNHYKYTPVMSTVYRVPIESTMNISIDYGDSYRTNPSQYIQNTPTKINSYIQDKSQYLYNDAYSSDQKAIPFTGQDKEDQLNNTNDCRIVYSQQKENNERIDSWLKFKSANYIDVDTRYGEITQLGLFKDTLLFWQKYATGIVSVNERTIIQDANDTNIILGNGDILQRYDYISTIYGMTKNQFTNVQSNTTLYWWDSLNKEILGYAGGQAVMPMVKVKKVFNHVNNNLSLENPSVVYDLKYNEVLFNVVKDGQKERVLVYNENIQQFSSLYDIPFDHAVSMPDRLFLMKNGVVFHRYNTENHVGMHGTILNEGDQVQIYPYLKYVVNKDSIYNKVYDLQTFGGRMYGGENLSNLNFAYSTPLKQHSSTDGDSLTNIEYDFRLAVPRDNDQSYGGRMRGKTMQCELWSDNNSTDFSLQYITTKYRMSWS